MDTISVVVPVISDNYLWSLLNDIHHNDVLPAEIIVIDNSETNIAEITAHSFPSLPIRYIPQEHNLGVNASWNLGLRLAKRKLVSVLNDDLVLPRCFFRLVEMVFNRWQNVGIAVPFTVGPKLTNGNPAPWKIGVPSEIRDAPSPLSPTLAHLANREGWAFTIRKQLFDPVPKELFTFCGDDWFFRCSKKRGYRAVKIANCRIYHYVGVSLDLEIRKQLNLPTFQQDRAAWDRIRRSTGV
jgi:GT2 family glycosyltransferase